MPRKSKNRGKKEKEIFVDAENKLLSSCETRNLALLKETLKNFHGTFGQKVWENVLTNCGIAEVTKH
ncbi:hypothetical protein RFI_30001 [Reticulomyxa filosa]|uniref:Uncharacterized protein n=1 Tax=Reticulomyxa filosa TaxID=46433 RepID=X6M1D5_RETFI|nr:hypothetical protein RFI_30001 [Reticulomyxa filosa]|eukprot:ETO07391.1 hypothetical protein RFI_30001 [Reticulomyxa filosa]